MIKLGVVAKELISGIIWYVLFFICSPIFLLAWIVYRLKGGSRPFMDWILYEASIQGLTRSK